MRVIICDKCGKKINEKYLELQIKSWYINGYSVHLCQDCMLSLPKWLLNYFVNELDADHLIKFKNIDKF